MRKIMKFQWGNSLLRQGMGSITPLQSSSDLYTAMTGLQSANFDKFSPANNPLLQAGAASGDMASKALLMNANTNKAVNGLSKSAANMATELLEILLNLVEDCLVKQISVTPCLRQEAMLI